MLVQLVFTKEGIYDGGQGGQVSTILQLMGKMDSRGAPHGTQG